MTDVRQLLQAIHEHWIAFIFVTLLFWSIFRRALQKEELRRLQLRKLRKDLGERV